MPVETRPVIINASGLCIRYSKQVVLDGATLTVHDGERIGVVGRNGTGKSTLLKILAGVEIADAGEITRKRESVNGFLSQEAQLDSHETVRDCILSGAKEVLDLIHRFETLPHDSPEHADLEQRIAAREGWTIERRMAELITRIGAPEPDREVDTLSGGEKRRVALCRALILQPDLLLLDEPTNHLDTDAIDWLEEFVTRRCHTCVLVTHDRHFLDRVATRVIELSNGTLYSHPGNYTAFLSAKAKREEMVEQEEARRQAFIRREIDWVRRGPKARGTKSRSRLDRFYAAAEKDGPEKELDVELVIPPAPRLANRVVELHGVGMAYGDRRLFSGLDFEFGPGDCVGIVGRNGLGKTTLLKIMLRQLEPSEGRVSVGERTEFNYVDQLRLKLNDEDNVWEAVGEGHEFVWLGDHRISLWTYLRRFMFTDERIRTPVGQLSGGERNRLLLAKILRRGGNFLILDEPTNDLDLSTLRMLEEALLAFRGCVVVVSHDRFFLNRVCTGILAFEGEGSVVYQEGDYDYYVAKRREREEAEKAHNERETREAQPTTPAPVKRRTGLTWKQERELEGMEGAILAVESEIERIESLFSLPDFFEKHGSEAGELKARLELRQGELASLFDRWEELEAIKADA